MDLKEVKTERFFTFIMSDEEARQLTTDLFNKKMGYRNPLSAAGMEMLEWLGSRNEDEPRGTE
jgi:hypothetical protein